MLTIFGFDGVSFHLLRITGWLRVFLLVFTLCRRKVVRFLFVNWLVPDIGFEFSTPFVKCNRVAEGADNRVAFGEWKGPRDKAHRVDSIPVSI